MTPFERLFWWWRRRTTPLGPIRSWEPDLDWKIDAIFTSQPLLSLLRQWEWEEEE